MLSIYILDVVYIDIWYVCYSRFSSIFWKKNNQILWCSIYVMSHILIPLSHSPKKSIWTLRIKITKKDDVWAASRFQVWCWRSLLANYESWPRSGVLLTRWLFLCQKDVIVVLGQFWDHMAILYPLMFWNVVTRSGQIFHQTASTLSYTGCKPGNKKDAHIFVRCKKCRDFFIIATSQILPKAGEGLLEADVIQIVCLGPGSKNRRNTNESDPETYIRNRIWEISRHT